MEKLKDLHEITLPDSRQLAFALRNRETGEIRSLDLRDIHENAANIQLHEGVPGEIRSHFATAQNLLAYSWFYYPFNVTAQFMAFVTLELALKKKFCESGKKLSFKRLVRMAVKHGLVKDEGFTHIVNNIDKENMSTEQQPIKRYVEILIDNIPYLRNELAHGSPMIHPSGALSVKICADFINQLFSPPTA